MKNITSLNAFKYNRKARKQNPGTSKRPSEGVERETRGETVN